MYLANTVFVSLFAISLMLWIDPRLTLIAMIPMVALPPITVGFGNLIHRRFEAIQERFGAMSTMVQENLAGVRIVKAYGQEREQTAKFGLLADDYLERNLSLARVSGLFHPLLGFVSGLALTGVLLLGGRGVMDGAISTGDFVAFMLYLGMLTWPMIALGWVVNLFQRGAASMRRINAILQTEPQISGSPDTGPLPAPLRGHIEFRNVSFRFPGTDREVLRDVSFTVEAGRMLALVGATGSGKSAVVALLARLYDPTAGEILIDGVPIRRIPLEWLRAGMGVVPQETFLFSDTIRENLSIGLPESGGDVDTEAAIRRASAIAQFDDTVQEFAGGYDTMLGERGVNLSGGQKQRATLARAIARNPRILILDDALSAVDTHTESRILRGLRSVLSERTSIVVSHRVTAVMDADLIIVLEDGRVVERGRHEELVNRAGPYATLLRRQLLAQEVGERETTVLARPTEQV
jgi:ATP-binding cassette subfamily B multidrug efflux pump